MKKIFVILLCAMLLFALPITAFAEDVDTSTEVTENLPSENEAATEGETSPHEETFTEIIAKYVKGHFEEISVVGTLIVTSLINKKKHGLLTGSIGVLNNNAISVANNSAEAIKTALEKVEGITSLVEGYKDEMTTLLGEIRKTAEEKETIEQMLRQVDAHLKTAKLANIEFANELAELLNLANIPNSKKDELYARHTKSVHELEAVEEVMSDDGKEA